MQSELYRVAKKVCTDSLGIKPKENVLIMTNPGEDLDKVSGAMYDASLESDAIPTIVRQPKKTQLDFMNEAARCALMSNPSIVMTVTEEKLGKDRVGMSAPYICGNEQFKHYATLLTEKKISRFITMPNITADSFVRAADVDYRDLKFITEQAGIFLSYGDSIHLTSRAGTDLTAKIDTAAHCHGGSIKNPGESENIPGGETFISPVPGTSNGRIVIDGVVTTLDNCIIPEEPVSLEVVNGTVKEISGGSEASALSYSLDFAMKKSEQFGMPLNNKEIGEIAAGTNPKAKIVPYILEAEKVRGTCHVALGSDYDHRIECLTHLDQVIKHPTLEVLKKGKVYHTLLKDGELKIELPDFS